MQMEHFFPQIQVKAKIKRSSSKTEHFFSSNSGEDQKKVYIKTRTLFSPNSGEDQKNKVFIKNRTLFSPIFSQMYTHSNYWGDIPILLGGYIIPFPPCFGTPEPIADCDYCFV